MSSRRSGPDLRTEPSETLEGMVSTGSGFIESGGWGRRQGDP